MSRPGVEVISRAEPLPRSAPTDTGVLFLVGTAAAGPTGPHLIRSLTEFVNVYGARAGAQDLYDWVETYFREGGSQVWISAAADAAGQVAALDVFDKGLGPGQVCAPGATDPADHAAILAHCAEKNRVALLDPPDNVADATALLAVAAGLQADANARYGALFAPAAVVPGIAGGTSRAIPYSIVEAGLIARSDVTNGAHVPAAGENGQAVFATDLVLKFTDAERETLNEGGVCTARLLWGGVRTYGYRTLVKTGTPAEVWLFLGWARLNMEITAQAEAIGERYLFRPIDGRGHTLSAFGGDLRAMLVPMYEDDALYGATPDDAFQVDVGSSVNTPETIAAGELHAVIEVKMAPDTEWVLIEIVKVATTQALAA